MVAVPGPTPVSSRAAIALQIVGSGVSHRETCLLLRQAKVEDLNLPLTARAIDDKQIGRFDVAMDNPLGMSRCDRRCGLLGKGHYLFGRQPVSAGFCKITLQRLSAEQLHHQVGAAILFPGVINCAYVGMIQRRRRPGFAQKALMRCMAGGVGRGCGRRVPGSRRGGSASQIRNQVAIRDQLQSDFALQPGIEYAIDFAHAAGADFLQQTIRTELCSFCNGHRCQQSISATVSVTSN